jgi:hypothetical protein
MRTLDISVEGEHDPQIKNEPFLTVKGADSLHSFWIRLIAALS